MERAITCYLSPVDALIEVLQSRQIDKAFKVMPAQLVSPELFRDADGRGLIANVRLGWPVLNGQLLLRPGGALGGYGRVMHHWAHAPLRFEFDEAVLAEVTRLYEWAGLFAWRETLSHLRTWTPDEIARVAARAATSFGAAKGDMTKCEQVALFDPESVKWHCVPRTGSSIWW